MNKKRILKRLVYVTPAVLCLLLLIEVYINVVVQMYNCDRYATVMFTLLFAIAAYNLCVGLILRVAYLFEGKVETVPLVRGKWESCTCTECGYGKQPLDRLFYCPSCGAKMDTEC